MDEECAFCSIANKTADSKIVFQDEDSLAFLDSRPVFHGHCLLVPKQHFKTIMSAPDELVEKLFKNVKLLSKAVMDAMHCDGVLLIMNNEVSQSVPHLHVHVIPRKKGEVLKGFMWPRHPYESAAQMDTTQQSIVEAVSRLMH